MGMKNLYVDPRSTEYNELRKKLTNLNNEVREITYIGMSQAIADIYVEVVNCQDLTGINIDILTIVDAIGEIAIIDRDVFKSKLSNAISFKVESRTNKFSILGAVCFEDFIGLTKYYSHMELIAINKNFSIFSSAYVVASEVFKKIISDSALD